MSPHSALQTLARAACREHSFKGFGAVLGIHKKGQSSSWSRAYEYHQDADELQKAYLAAFEASASSPMVAAGERWVQAVMRQSGQPPAGFSRAQLAWPGDINGPTKCDQGSGSL